MVIGVIASHNHSGGYRALNYCVKRDFFFFLNSFIRPSSRIYMFFQMIDKYSIDFKHYRLKSLHYIYKHDRWDYE